MNDLAGILENCALFQGLSREWIEQALLPYGTVRQFPKHGEIISIQERVDWFGIVLEGRVHMLQMFSNGVCSLMGSLLPGYMLGLDLICTKSRKAPYCASAHAQTHVLVFSDSVLMEPGALPEPERMVVWRNLLTMLSQENMRKHNRLAVLAQRGLRDRVLTFLTMQAGRRQSGSFRIPFSREELADYLCVNRSCLSHELSRMAQDGLIRFHKNQFTLLPEGFRQSNWSILE